LDAADPNFETFEFTWLSAHSQQYAQTPWEVFFYIGSGDGTLGRGAGAGPDWDTFLAGKQQQEPAYMPVVTSPMQTATVTPAYGSGTILYDDPVVYSKVPAASPPAVPSIAT